MFHDGASGPDYVKIRKYKGVSKLSSLFNEDKFPEIDWLILTACQLVYGYLMPRREFFCTQLYDIKYSYNLQAVVWFQIFLLRIILRFQVFFLFDKSNLFALSYMFSNN